MKQTRLLMNMPITIEIVDERVDSSAFDLAFKRFSEIEDRYSPFKPTSEVWAINSGKLDVKESSEEMQTVVALCDQTKAETSGYFDVYHAGKFNPSGLVKGWAIREVANLLTDLGFENFFVDAGGDIQVKGKNAQGKNWSVGVRNPWEKSQIVKVLRLQEEGVATSGTYERGQHIYNPLAQDEPLTEVMSLTVVGPDVYEADRFATAAFAMQAQGIQFIEKLKGFEGYMIDGKGMATMTSGFKQYLGEV